MTLLMDLKLEMEYKDVALRRENLAAANLDSIEVGKLIDRLTTVAEEVRVDFKHRPLSVDQADDLVLDVAINGKAGVIVTHNMRHFAAAKSFGIAVMTPARLLVEMRG